MRMTPCDFQKATAFSLATLPRKSKVVSEEEFLAKLPEIAANAEQDACTPENPRETKAADFEKILKACYYDTDIDF